MEKNENQRYYFSTVGQEEKIQLLKILSSKSKIIGLWEKGIKEKDIQMFKVVAFNQSSLLLTLKPEKQSFFKGFLQKEYHNKEVFCKFDIYHASYFTQSFLSYDMKKDVYNLVFERDLYCGKRRADYRLQASSRILIQFKIDDYIFNCVDISASGLNCFIDPKTYSKAEKGTVLVNGTLTFCGQDYVIPKAHIVKIDQIENSGLVTAGMLFKNLSKSMEESLCIKINSEVQTEEIHKLFFSKTKVKKSGIEG